MQPVVLPASVRRRLERLLDADLTSVRVYVSSRATMVGAVAYTRGEQVVFAPGRYDPYSVEGYARLAHEMTHVVQQRDGRAGSARSSGGSMLVDPQLEAEAEANAQRAIRSAPPGPDKTTGAPWRRAPHPTSSSRPRPTPGSWQRPAPVAQPILGYLRDGLNGGLAAGVQAAGWFQQLAARGWNYGTQQVVNAWGYGAATIADTSAAIRAGGARAWQYGTQALGWARARVSAGAQWAWAGVVQGTTRLATYLARTIRTAIRDGWFRLGMLGAGTAAAVAATYGFPISAVVPLMQSYSPFILTAALEQVTPPLLNSMFQALGGLAGEYPLISSAIMGTSLPYLVDLGRFYRMRYYYTPERSGYHSLARHSAWHTPWNMLQRIVPINPNTALSLMQDWSGQYIRSNNTSSQFSSEGWHAYAIEQANAQLLALHPLATIVEHQPNHTVGGAAGRERFTIEYPGWAVGLSYTAGGTQVVEYVFSNFIQGRNAGGPTNEWFLIQNYPQATAAPANYQHFVPLWRYFF